MAEISEKVAILSSIFFKISSHLTWHVTGKPHKPHYQISTA